MRVRKPARVSKRRTKFGLSLEESAKEILADLKVKRLSVQPIVSSNDAEVKRSSEFGPIFEALKPVLAQSAGRLAVKADTRTEYTLVSKRPSPFPQHKGQPMLFGSVRQGKAYVSFHLMPLYMCPELTKQISPALKKKMQGKTCFNFTKYPEPELVAELARLTQAGFEQWHQRKWV